MKRILEGIKLGIIIILVIVLLVPSSKNSTDLQNEIEQRALSLEEKDCYDWQDIEVIIFGEIQE